MTLTGDILKSSNNRQVIILGLVIGFLAGVFPGPAAVVLTMALLLLYTRRVSQRWDDPRPFRILVIGFSLRLLVIAVLALLSILKGELFIIFGDSKLYFDASLNALSIYAGILDSTSGSSSLYPSYYGYNFFNWIYGAIYYLFGYSPVLIRLFNTLSSCLLAWMVYLITYRICEHRTSAAWAMGLTMFWPSQILWSITLLKEPMLALYVSVIIYLFVDMIKRKRWYYLIPLGLLWYPMKVIRVNSHVVMLLTILLSLILFLPRRRIIGVVLVLLLAVVGLGVGRSHIKSGYQIFHNMVVNSQMGFITTGGSYYKFIPERFKPVGGNRETMSAKEMTISVFRAVYYYLSVPNPFVRLKKSQVPVVPQMLAWYVLLLFCFPVGILYLARHYYRESGIILIYILVFTGALALNTGNVGAAFRQRDMLTPFYFIPISVGLINLLGWISFKLNRRNKLQQPSSNSLS